MLSISVIGAILVIVPVALGTVHMEGRCPNYIPVPNFNRSQVINLIWSFCGLTNERYFTVEMVKDNLLFSIKERS